MFVDLPQQLVLLTVGAFLIGWLLSSISSGTGSRDSDNRGESQDDRIRSLEAELRVAQADLEKDREKLAEQEKNLEERTCPKMTREVSGVLET